MSAFVIEGGHCLSGEIEPQGAKNEALQVICATLLTPEKVIIHNIPDILDVNNLIQILVNFFNFFNQKYIDQHILCINCIEFLIKKI